MRQRTSSSFVNMVLLAAGVLAACLVWAIGPLERPAFAGADDDESERSDGRSGMDQHSRDISPSATASQPASPVLPDQATAPRFYYHYFKEAIALALDADRIAVFRRASPKVPAQLKDPVEPAPDLGAFGIPAANVTPWRIAGWSLANLPETPGVPEAARGEGTTRLIDRIAREARDVSFVSPMFVEAYGPVLVTADLLVGFADGITVEQAEAMLRNAVPGRVTDIDYARMKNVYRFRSSAKNGLEVLNAANTLALRAEVRFAEPDMLCSGRTSAVIPDDPLFFRQWGLHNTGENPVEGLNEVCCAVPCPGDCWPPCPDVCVVYPPMLPCDDYPDGLPGFDMDAPEAWDITTGDPSVIVVVFDSGTQLDHPDLMIDPSLGMDFTGQNTGGYPANDCDTHGTQVVGTIRMQMNNGIGGAGIAPNCSAASAKVFTIDPPDPVTLECSNRFSGASFSWFINGLDWAQSIGARVTNHSYGLRPPSSALTQKLTDTRAAGLIHFVAAGNDAHTNLDDEYPANLPSVQAVSAVRIPGDLAPFSNYGDGLAFAAPGVFVWSSDETGADSYGGYGVDLCNNYAPVSGTSFASPLSAGVAALILSVNPSWSADDVVKIMRDSAVDLGDPGYDIRYGWGMVNAFNAVTLAGNRRPDAPALVSPADGATGRALNLQLGASTFFDPDGDSHAGSQWQVDDQSDFSSTAWDSGDSYPAATETAVPVGPLRPLATYFWRVRYQDDHGWWSDWSTSWQFTTATDGDFDDDDDVDQEDFGRLQTCLGRTGEPRYDPACRAVRMDADDDVDPQDAELFLQCLSGPNVPAAQDCMGGVP